MTLHPTSAGSGPRKRPLSVDDYHRMIEVGVLRPDERVELIEGELFEMSPHGPPRATLIAVLTRRLARQLSDDWTLRVQLPLTVPPHSEPEPDVAVARGPEAQYRDAHPRTAALVVEVADSSLGIDRQKTGLYAAAGVEECWLVDVAGHAVEVYRDPDAEAGRYGTMETLSPGDTLQAGSIADVRIPVADLFE